MQTALPPALPAAGPGAAPVPARTRSLPAAAPWFDPLRIMLVVLMVFTIGRLHQHFGFLAALRPSFLLAVGAAAYAFLNPRALAPGRVLDCWPARVVAGLAVIASFSIVFGISLGQSASYMLGYYSKVLIFFLLLVLAIRGIRDLSLLVWGYLLGVAFLCYLCIFVYGMVSYYGSLTARLNDEAMYMYDPNDIGVLLTTAIPLALLQYLTSGWKGKVASAVILVAIGWATALSGSRGGLLGVVAVGVPLLVVLRQVSVVKRAAFVAAVAVTMTVAAPPGYWAQMETIVNPEDDYNWSSEDGRMQIWKRGMGYMLDYPLFGVGLDNFGRAEGTLSDKARNRVAGTGLVFTAPHNSFVQVAAELGIPGLVLFSSLVVGGIVGMARLHRRLPPGWKDGDPDERYVFHATLFLPISLVGFAVTASFVSFAYLDPIYIFAAYMTGILAWVRERRERETGGRRRHWRVARGAEVAA